MSSAALYLPTFEDLYAEIEALPEGMTGEILGPGDLRTMARPGAAHRLSAHRVGSALRGSNLMDGGVGWWIEVEVEIQLPGGRLYVPDLAGWRVSEEPAFVEDNPITVVPDWACEILSRGTQRGDRAFKLPTYAAAGVGHMWILDPEAKTVEVYETRQGLPVLVATAVGPVTAMLPPFSEPMDVERFWKRAR